ncbi:L-serine ammonia-lyase, iron-sulfur-dependent, subunit alpha [Mycoplasmatota bacterium WC30]
MSKFQYEEEFFQILKEELVPAAGCTEPISLAFAGAKARELLKGIPDKAVISCSGNLIKNIRCVTVPNTGNLVGIEASLLAGFVGGNSSKGLEVISDLNESHIVKMNLLLLKKFITVKLLETPVTLHFILYCEKGDNSCEIEIKDLHTNIVSIKENDKITFEKPTGLEEFCGVETDRSVLTIEKILDFSNQVDFSLLKELLEIQVKYNMAIATAGMEQPFSVSIGPTILKHNSSIYGKMKAYTAAASEARMSGCSLPVITNSGSGNQGLATSIPVILYSRHKYVSEEKMYRALVLSNLLTLYQKSFIGRLSAFCGAISAAVSSGATLTYLEGGSLDQIKMSIINALANVSGVVCDGAKPSCAAKIVTGLEAAFLGHFLAMENQSYNPFSGIIKKDADATISAVGQMARQGMKETDQVILNIMLESK